MYADLNIVLKFVREVWKEERELEKIPPEELNVYLSESPRNVRPLKPRMYENKEIPAKPNPVNVYKLCRDRHPQSMLEPDAPFYLMVNHFKSSVQGWQNDCTWFKAQPMGVNKLNSILKDMSGAGEIFCKTNHTGRNPAKSGSRDNRPQKSPVNKQLQQPTRTTNEKHFKHSLKQGVHEL